jgi:hypothetical protein
MNPYIPIECADRASPCSMSSHGLQDKDSDPCQVRGRMRQFRPLLELATRHDILVNEARVLGRGYGWLN